MPRASILAFLIFVPWSLLLYLAWRLVAAITSKKGEMVSAGTPEFIAPKMVKPQHITHRKRGPVRIGGRLVHPSVLRLRRAQ